MKANDKEEKVAARIVPFDKSFLKQKLLENSASSYVLSKIKQQYYSMPSEFDWLKRLIQSSDFNQNISLRIDDKFRNSFSYFYLDPHRVDISIDPSHVKIGSIWHEIGHILYMGFPQIAEKFKQEVFKDIDILSRNGWERLVCIITNLFVFPQESLYSNQSIVFPLILHIATSDKITGSGIASMPKYLAEGLEKDFVPLGIYTKEYFSRNSMEYENELFAEALRVAVMNANTPSNPGIACMHDVLPNACEFLFKEREYIANVLHTTARKERGSCIDAADKL